MYIKRRWVRYFRSLATGQGMPEQPFLIERLKYVLNLLHVPRAAGGNGNNALSDLPWYLIMGAQGSGKTSLLTQSGLAASSVGAEAPEGQEIQQYCDWYFSPDAVFVDTASRYLDDGQSVVGFSSFLKRLKKCRKPLAINGVVLTISLPELIAATASERDALAARLSRRVREYAHVLWASPPIYLMLTKVDLLPGFDGVFKGLSTEVRQQPWGMNFPTVGGSQESVLDLFDDQFAQLLSHLRQHIEQHALDSTTPLATEVLQFAQHFAALSSVLKPFVAQFVQGGHDQPTIYLRALHFTSALQSSDDSLPAPFKNHLINAFGLRQPVPGIEQATSNRSGHLGYFITGVFRDVVFPDRDAGLHRPLAVQRRGGRLLVVGLILALFACLLGWEGLSLFSYRQWLGEVSRDLKFVAQSERSNDPSREVQQLELLRVHLIKVESFTQGYGSWRKQFDVYGIKSIQQALGSAYSQAMTKVLLEPVSKYLQHRLSALDEFSEGPADESALAGAVVRETSFQGTQGPDLSIRVRDNLNETQVASISEGYNLLKLYLMLTDPRAHPDAEFTETLLALIWAAAMAAEGINVDPEIIAANSAQYVRDLASGPAKALARNEPLVSETQRRLRSFSAASSLVDREYLRLQMASGQRFAAVTLADLVPLPGRQQLYSSEAVPALYTRKGWETFFKPELIKLLASELQQETDWVLDGTDDGQNVVQKTQFLGELMARYKADYAQAWYRFIESAGVRHFAGLDLAVQRLTLLSDVQNSPVKALLLTVDGNTRWDLPQNLEPGGSEAAGAVSLLNPYWLMVNDGSLAKSFEPVSRLFAADNPEGADHTIMDRYLSALRKLKVRLSNIQRSQNIGKTGRQLISETLDGQPTEVAGVRNYIESSVDTSESGLSQALRRLFSSPVEYAWASLREPAGLQIKDEWQRQIVRPWQKVIAHRFPVTEGSPNEASVKDLQRFIHPESGLLTAFKRDQIGNLADGEGIQPVGIRQIKPLVSPRVITQITQSEAVGQVLLSLADQENGFELMIDPAAAFTDVVFTLDGQTLHYRNGKTRWIRFVWPEPTGTPGARLDVVTLEGKRITVFDHPGRWGLLKMNDSAQVSNLDEVRQRFTWATEFGDVSFVVRNYGGVKLTDLAGVKTLRFTADAVRSN